MTAGRAKAFGEARYVSPRKRRGREKPRMNLPLTSMIDVVFLLLLFFILTTQFRRAEGELTSLLPQGQAAARDVSQIYRPIEIHIRWKPGEGGSLGVVAYEVSRAQAPLSDPQSLYEYLRLQRDKLGSDEVPIVIAPGFFVPQAFVVEALNAAQRACFKRIGYAKPSPEGQMG